MTAIRSINLPERFDFSFNKPFMSQYQAILDAPQGANKIELNFNRVKYLDSSALGMMVLLQKKALKQNISVSVKGAKNAAKDILKIANFEKLYSFE